MLPLLKFGPEVWTIEVSHLLGLRIRIQGKGFVFWVRDLCLQLGIGIQG